MYVYKYIQIVILYLFLVCYHYLLNYLYIYKKYLKHSCNTNPQKTTKSVRGRRAGGKIIVKT